MDTDTHTGRATRARRPRMLVAVAVCLCISGAIPGRPASVRPQPQLGPSPSPNALRLVTSRTELHANDYVDLTQFP